MIAILSAGCHVVWSLLVLIGWAQPILDFIFWAHMIKPVYFVKPFDPMAAVALIAITECHRICLWFSGRGDLEPAASSLIRAQKTSGFVNRCQATQRKGAHGIAMKTPSIRDILMPIDFSQMLAGLRER